MPSLIDIRNFLTGLTGQNVELLGINTTSEKRTTSFQIRSGSNISTKLKSVDIVITTRAPHPNDAEKDAFEWFEKLENKTNFKIGDTQIILIRSISYPSYLGRYDNGLFYFTVSFSILMEVQ